MQILESSTCAIAAVSGQMATVQWMSEHGWFWDWMVCAHAAKGGHLAILQWARRHGCAWSAETCTEAAMHGHLATLRWAHEHGCPWNEDTTCAALQSRHLTLYLWARRNGCPSCVTQEASARRMVHAVTISNLLLRSAAPSQVPHEVLRSIVMKGHELVNSDEWQLIVVHTFTLGNRWTVCDCPVELGMTPQCCPVAA